MSKCYVMQTVILVDLTPVLVMAVNLQQSCCSMSVDLQTYYVVLKEHSNTLVLHF